MELRFTRDMTQAEIAESMGLSAMQVSRLLRRILDELREHLEPADLRPVELVRPDAGGGTPDAGGGTPDADRPAARATSAARWVHGGRGTTGLMSA